MGRVSPRYGRRFYAAKVRVGAGLGLVEAGVGPQVGERQEDPLTRGTVKQVPTLQPEYLFSPVFIFSDYFSILKGLSHQIRFAYL